mgnify:CR=1 FL=1
MGVKVYTKGLEDLEMEISEYGKRVTPLMKRAVYAGAGQIADNVRANLNAAVSDKATGELAECININRIGAKDGNVYTSVGFDGYINDFNTPAPIAAAVLESGRSDQPGRKKTHFFSKAVRAARVSALEAMREEVYRYLDELKKD